MRILVTGGAGFIGRHLAAALRSSHAVTCCGRRELDLLDADQVAACLKDGRFDAVIHAATYDAAPKHSTKDPARVLENNLRMFFNVARCRGAFGKLLYFGSGAEFSRAHWVPQMGEDYFDQHVPSDQYGFSKYVMTRHAMQPGSNVYNLRLFGVYGEDDDWRTRFISNACCRAVMGQPIIMNQNRVFDHLYIGDLARIVQWFVEHTPSRNVYNVCSGTTYDFQMLAGMLLGISGKTLGIAARTPGLGMEYSGANSLLRKELGDFAFTPMRDGLAAVYQWHESNREIIQPEQL